MSLANSLLRPRRHSLPERILALARAPRERARLLTAAIGRVQSLDQDKPILLDANWSNGDYYGKAEPVAGLSTALSMVTLHAQHWKWANSKFGRNWAIEGKDPANCLVECKYAIEAALDAAGKARAAKMDANHFLYLVKAGQIFVTGGNLTEGLKRIDAPVLLISTDDDLIFRPMRSTIRRS